jgi:CheY-like chemotaxis protein
MNPGPNTLQSERRAKTIFAVDDSTEMQPILQAALTGAGYAIISALSAAECLAGLKERRADGFLLDIQMPNVDGLELCRAIRKLGGYKDTPIIFLTVNNTHDDIKRCIEAGGNDYIVKPVNAKTLVQRLDRWVLKRAAKADAG